MRRILHVVGRMDRGGTESMLMNHYRHIDTSKYQFDFVVHTTEKSDFEDEIIALGGRILRVPRFNLLNYFQYCKAWKYLLSSHTEYKIIHVHHFLVAGIVLPIAAELGIKTRIVHSHNTKPPIFILKEKVMWLFHHDLIRYSTLKLACSQAAGEYLFGKKEFTVFNNAIETSVFRYDASKRNILRNYFGLSEEHFIIGHVGSFRTRQKNHSFIIDIFAEVAKRNTNARLLLVGVGQLQKEIKDKVMALSLGERCIFAGLRDDVPALLSAMDVFLFPSFFEGLSVVSIEAQAAGLPIVASNRVTSESKITDLFEQLDLNCPIDRWVDAVLSAKPAFRREAYSEIVSNNGYGVEKNVIKLLSIYNSNE